MSIDALDRRAGRAQRGEGKMGKTYDVAVVGAGVFGVVSKNWMRLITQEVRESVQPRSTACHSPLRDATLSQ